MNAEKDVRGCVSCSGRSAHPKADERCRACAGSITCLIIRGPAEDAELADHQQQCSCCARNSHKHLPELLSVQKWLMRCCRSEQAG